MMKSSQYQVGINYKNINIYQPRDFLDVELVNVGYVEVRQEVEKVTRAELGTAVG